MPEGAVIYIHLIAVHIVLKQEGKRKEKDRKTHHQTHPSNFLLSSLQADLEQAIPFVFHRRCPPEHAGGRVLNTVCGICFMHSIHFLTKCELILSSLCSPVNNLLILLSVFSFIFTLFSSKFPDILYFFLFWDILHEYTVFNYF